MTVFLFVFAWTIRFPPEGHSHTQETYRSDPGNQRPWQFRNDITDQHGHDWDAIWGAIGLARS